MDLGSRIASWRKLKGFTRRELAEAVGVSTAAVYQWEGTGDSKTSPSQPHLEAVVRALGLTMERFYGRIRTDRKAS
jgi:transcriptional regulator with XRE-family HTH domain